MAAALSKLPLSVSSDRATNGLLLLYEGGELPFQAFNICSVLGGKNQQVTRGDRANREKQWRQTHPTCLN